MKKVLITFSLMFLLFANANAKDIRVILTNPAGSSTDMLTKSISEAYYKLTGDNFVIDYAPGGGGAVAAVKFQNANPNTVLVGITSLHIYNPVLKNNLPYKDSDFKYVSFLGYGPAMYISNTASGIKTINDLLTKLPKSDKPFIGGYAIAYNLSVNILKNSGKLPKNIEIIGHKGAPDVLLNVLNGSVPVGLIGTTSNLIQLAKEGRINIIGSTHEEDIEIQGLKIPSVGKALGVTQTTGGFLISIKPNADKKFASEFEANIKKAVLSDTVQATMKKYNIFPANIFGAIDTEKRIKSFRKTVEQNIK